MLHEKFTNTQDLIDTTIAHNTTVLKSLHSIPETPASEDITQKLIISNRSLNVDSKNDS